MRTIATTLAAMLAVLLGAFAFAQTPKVLGWERSQAVPESAIVKQGRSEGPLKQAHVQPVAGLDAVEVAYTEKLGVCAAYGYDSFSFSLQVDRWAEHVATKFGGVAGTKIELAQGKFVTYGWFGDDVPEGYSKVAVAGPLESDGRYFR